MKLKTGIIKFNSTNISTYIHWTTFWRAITCARHHHASAVYYCLHSITLCYLVSLHNVKIIQIHVITYYMHIFICKLVLVPNAFMLLIHCVSYSNVYISYLYWPHGRTAVAIRTADNGLSAIFLSYISLLCTFKMLNYTEIKPNQTKLTHWKINWK